VIGESTHLESAEVRGRFARIQRFVAVAAGPVLFALGVGILAYPMIQTWSDTGIYRGFDLPLYEAGTSEACPTWI
jgi:hypothetical protein